MRQRKRVASNAPLFIGLGVGGLVIAGVVVAVLVMPREPQRLSPEEADKLISPKAKAYIKAKIEAEARRIDAEQGN